jgi:hypothetical protein
MGHKSKGAKKRNKWYASMLWEKPRTDTGRPSPRAPSNRQDSPTPQRPFKNAPFEQLDAEAFAQGLLLLVLGARGPVVGDLAAQVGVHERKVLVHLQEE